MARGDMDPMMSYTGEEIPEGRRTLGVSEASPGPNTFEDGSGFAYRFEPETGSYTIVAAPPEYQNLVGVTVSPGSHAFDSIQSVHQGGESLYQAEEAAPAEAAEEAVPAETQYAAQGFVPETPAQPAAAPATLMPPTPPQYAASAAPAADEGGDAGDATVPTEAMLRGEPEPEPHVPAHWSDPIRGVMEKMRGFGDRFVGPSEEEQAGMQAEREARRARRELEGRNFLGIRTQSGPYIAPKE